MRLYLSRDRNKLYLNKDIFMIHKFCENHLVELYEAIKADKIGEIKRIEHELSPSEECVACAYAFKAKGEAREVLGEYLRSEGFAVESSPNESIGSTFWFWAVRALIFLAVLLLLVLVLKTFLPLIVSFIMALVISVTVLLVFQ